MTKKTPSDQLILAAPPDELPVGSAEESVSDLKRILALSRRPVVNCERDRATRRYEPATQALIEVVTAKFSRGTRVSCACRPRKIKLGADGALEITRSLPEGEVPEPPIRASVKEFVADCRTSAAELEVAKRVLSMRPGEEISLPAADGFFGHPCIKVLNAVQAWLLREAPQVGGGVGFAGVGSGKSLSFLLAPLVFPDAKLAVLVIEPKQRQHYRSQYLRVREHFRVTSIVFDDGPPYTVPGTPPLHLISYSVLSRKESTQLLEDLSPDVLLLDECHRSASQSAIGRRIRRYLATMIAKREAAMLRGEQVRARAVRLIGASGTLESKSVNDTQMLSAFALGTGSPLPLDLTEAERWTAVIDPSSRPDYTSTTSCELQISFAGRLFESSSLDTLLAEKPEKAIREGFMRRRSETLGVISASASAINAAIYFTERKAPSLPDVVKEALAKVRNDSLRPDGELLVEKIEQVSTARNVACGFYAYWAFPKHPCVCPASLGPADSRCDNCQLIERWYAKRKAYNKELRTKLLEGEAHLDSPQLCQEAAERFYQDPPYKGDLPVWQSEAWPEWRDIENKVEHDERIEWLGWNTPEAADPKTHPGYFLARDAAEWALQNRGVVWFQSVALGRKIAELSGLPYFNGGPGGEERLRAEKGNRSIIVSISAHGAGTDGLQNIISDQLIAEIPASNSSQRGIEQLFGRLHREGQTKDAVNTQAYLHVSEFRDALRKAYAQAEFNAAMTNTQQKLLCCDMEEGMI